jgi:hypothetical protein
LPTHDFIIALFCRIDDRMRGVKKRKNAKLYPSELVTIACLWAMKGGSSRAFYRWLRRDYLCLFPALPERTRLFRAIAKHREWADAFLEGTTFFSIADSFGVELLHPRREGRSDSQIGKKGKSNGRWIVGAKFVPLVNQYGLISDWDYDSANVADNAFDDSVIGCHQSGERGTCTFSDKGFHRSRKRGGDPPNLVICQRGERNERMLVETVFSLFTGVLHMKRLYLRAWDYLEARIGFAVAIYNLLVLWDGLVADENGRTRLSIAEFAL